MMRSALSGIRVLEFGTGYVGPVVALRLAEFGADVVKVESHRGLDFMRGQSPTQHELSLASSTSTATSAAPASTPLRPAATTCCCVW